MVTIMFMKIKTFIVIFVAVFAVVMFLLRPQPGDNNSSQKVTGLPWQIEVLPDGKTVVFGITLGQSTFADVRRQADGGEVAIMSLGAADVSLEMYVKSFRAGMLTGRLIVVASQTATQLADMRSRAIRSGGENRFKLHADDRAGAQNAVVESVTFIPHANLDAEVISQRFGMPVQVIKTSEIISHHLYPDKGLDIILDKEGKEVLQYVLPAKFSMLRKPLVEKSDKSLQ